MGYSMCRRSWRRLLGVNPCLALKQWKAGNTCYTTGRIERQSEVMDAIHGSLIIIIKHFEKSNPYSHLHGKDLHSDEVLLPFTDKRTLFLLLKRWYDMRVGTSGGEPVPTGAPGALRALRDLKFPLVRAPRYKTFIKVLRRSEFARVKFHRFVNMERCPKCCLYRYKLMTCHGAERSQWERLTADHQFLQIAQKRRYAEDRAIAASDFPKSELYMALDGGSGYDFVFPHLSPNDAELPSKAVKGIHTLPMKVMNCLLHGDTRSHVILSPGSIVAGANHLCESVMVMVNSAYGDHGAIPPTITVQLDNASVNHNILTLGFMSLYVLHGVTDTVRVRFELENHAHDIYDAFGAIHARAVRRQTYYSMSELHGIIQAAHVLQDAGTAILPKNPLMGRDVQVTNLWEIRDIWQWLMPGHGESTVRGNAESADTDHDHMHRGQDK
jgi:hypothetical protein